MKLETVDSGELVNGGMLICHQLVVGPSHKVVGYRLAADFPCGGLSSHSCGPGPVLQLLAPRIEADAFFAATFTVGCSTAGLQGWVPSPVRTSAVVVELKADHRTPLSTDVLGVLREARKCGYGVAVPAQLYALHTADLSDVATHAVVCSAGTNQQELAKLVGVCKALKLIGIEASTRADVETLSALGVELICGGWVYRPAGPAAEKSIRPSQASSLRLLDLVRKKASPDEIEEVLKQDPRLSFNLMRFINSAEFGLRTEISSFKHAVMLLGLKRLFKWSALLVTTGERDSSPAAVGFAAVLRGRFMELLVMEARVSEESDNAFVTGVFSMLDTMLGIPLEEAFKSVALPGIVTDALINTAGPLMPFLRIVLSCEAGDSNTAADAAKISGLTLEQINWAQLQAFSWVQKLGAC